MLPKIFRTVSKSSKGGITGRLFQKESKMNREVTIAFTYQIMFKLRAKLFITFDVRPKRTRILSNPICC